MKVKEPKTIDFFRSNISWVTKNGSYGVFNVEAVMRILPPNADHFISYALTPPVLAGNMYSVGPLNKFPPYLFQVAGGDTEHVIFRSDMSGDLLHRFFYPSYLKDSYAENCQVFEAFKLNLVERSSELLSTYEDISRYFFKRSQFSSLISIKSDCGYEIELEFPVKHLNILPDRKMWQLETGPILHLKKNVCSSQIGNVGKELLPYFIHANNFEYADFSPNFPIVRSMDSRSTGVKTKRIGCQLKLFAFN